MPRKAAKEPVERTYSTRSKSAPKESLSEIKKKKSTTPKQTKKTTKTESKTTHEHEHEEAEVVERGNIYFFYRKKVEHKSSESMDDVQKLYILLWPKMDQDKHTHPLRLLMISKKKMPEISKHGKYWALIEKVSFFVDDMHNQLDPYHYATKTLGERHFEGAVPVGEGKYDLINSKRHTHLAYVLHVPHEIGPVQKSFNIEPEGSYILSVKNPLEKGIYPKELKEVFEDRKWNKAYPISLLDYEGIELLIIGASKDLIGELKEIGSEMEDLITKAHSHKLSDEKLFNDLHMKKKEHPPEPLFTGKWK